MIGNVLNLLVTLFLLNVTGTTFNYFLDDKINKAEILFPGVACFLIAVCLGSAVHSSNAADNKAKLESMPTDHVDGEKYVSSSYRFWKLVFFSWFAIFLP